MVKVYNIVLLLFMTISSVAQNHKLPENNIKILAFVEKNIGKRVGGGVCRALPGHAIKQVNPSWNIFKWYGKRIPKKKAMEGDMLYFKNALIDNVYTKAHIAIIYKIMPNGTYLIAEQNVEDKPHYSTRKDSKVVISVLSSLKPKKGEIICYRYK